MSRKIRLFIQIGLAAAAVIMIAVGMSRGEAGMVMQKAVMICLECIGIG